MVEKWFRSCAIPEHVPVLRSTESNVEEVYNITNCDNDNFTLKWIQEVYSIAVIFYVVPLYSLSTALYLFIILEFKT